MKRLKFFLFAGICTFVLLAAGLKQPGIITAVARSGKSDSTFITHEMSPTVATPELIELAFARQEIDADERLLYLAYAVYDYRSLPESFHSHVPWWGTEVVREIKDAARKKTLSSKSLSSTESKFMDLLSPDAATVCDREDGANNYSSTHFRLNYGTIGGGLGYSDYTASLETTYATEVTSYGWAAPPYTAGNPWGRYPVQVASLISGLYGYVTSGGGDYTGFIGNNPNTAQTETVAKASCMVLNSDYTYFPTGALGSLQATAAHEFVHSIQFGVGDQGSQEDDIWYESIATYMEDDVFDDVNDNYYYLWPNFNTCLGQFSGNVYANWLFFRYAAEHNGGANLAGGGEDVAQGFWTNVSSQGQTGLQAYNNALGLKSSNLPDAFHDYAIATIFMQSCPTASPYCYEEAAGYLAEAGSIPYHGSITAVPGTYSGSVMNNYGQNWIGLPVTVPVDITLQNQSASGQLRGSIVAQTAGGLSVTPFTVVVGSSSSTTLTGYLPPAGTTRLVAVITNQQQTANNPSSCSATSYTLSLSQSLVSYDYAIYFPFIARAQSAVQSSMKGKVTYRGSPVSGTTVSLQYYDGSSLSTYATTTTNSSGDYEFQDHPPLGSDMYKYVLWDNPDDDDVLLWGWACTEVDQASDLTGDHYTCNFDLENIRLLSPASGATVSLPRYFYWQPRWSTSDSYEFALYDISDYDPYWYSEPLGYVGNYLLGSLPSGFSPWVTYSWEVWVYGPDGYGLSYYYRYVTFNNYSRSLNPPSSAHSRPPISDEFMIRPRSGE